jgi:hypothetical protein
MYARMIYGNWYLYQSVREGENVRSVYLGKVV